MKSIFVRGMMNLLLTVILIRGIFIQGGWFQVIYSTIVLLLLLDSMGDLGKEIEEKFLKHRE